MHGNPPPDPDSHASVDSGLAHQLHHMVMRRVHHRLSVHAQDFVSGAKTSVEISSAARYNVSNGNLIRKMNN